MKKTLILIFAFLLFLLSSCNNRSYQSTSFFAMDTFIEIRAENASSELLEKIKNQVYDDENKFSRTLSVSEIYMLNSSECGTQISDEAAGLLYKALEISNATNGAFSPTLGALVDLWNIKSENPKVPEKDEVSALLDICDAAEISVSDGFVQKKNKDTKIDLGGIAKGYSAKKCADMLKENGVENALISFGGSIACLGNADKSSDGWKIGIKNPFNTQEIIGSVRISDCYLAVSGAYERYFEKDGVRYHHILDPKTGYPAKSDIESSAVISSDGTLADALSTALFVLGKDAAISLYNSSVYDFEAILIMTDGSVYVSDGIRESFEFNETARFKGESKLNYKN